METNRSTKFPIPKNELYYWDDVEKALKPLIDTDGAVAVKGEVSVGVTSSDIMQPVDLQSRYQQTIQTHTATMVAPDGVGQSVYVDTNGFDRLAVTVTTDSTMGTKIQLVWSNDGVSQHGVDSLSSTPDKWYTHETATKARYVKIYVVNNDASAPHTMSSWTYLKA